MLIGEGPRKLQCVLDSCSLNRNRPQSCLTMDTGFFIPKKLNELQRSNQKTGVRVPHQKTGPFFFDSPLVFESPNGEKAKEGRDNFRRESGSPHHQMWLPFVQVRIKFEMAIDVNVARLVTNDSGLNVWSISLLVLPVDVKTP